MNIRNSACYLIGGLYFLLFSAACVCSPPGSVTGKDPVVAPTQQMQEASAPADEEVIMEEGTVGVTGDETIVEDGTTEFVSEEGTVVDEGTTVEVGSEEGTVIDEGTTTTIDSDMPVDGSPVNP
ncbi:hypothetical protein VU08_06100 [Desulfobulbus sp. F5]|nr:hypothetical protein [Desulfobulbus sp. F5]